MVGLGSGPGESMAYWFAPRDHDELPAERAALGDCELAVMRIGGEWEWLVMREGREIAAGAAVRHDDARMQAEAAAQEINRLALG